MAYTKTTTTGYGERLGNSIKGIGTGFVFLVLGTILLWWNEGRFVSTEKMIEEAQGSCVSVEDVSTVNPEYDGQLIHAVANTKTTDSISDPMFAVGAVCVKIEREVEYYQWVETSHSEKKDKLGGKEETTTTYTYSQKWVKKPVNSSEFEDPQYKGIANAPLMQNVENNAVTAENVTFGGYRLPEFLINGISGARPLNINLPKDQVEKINAVIAVQKPKQPKNAQQPAAQQPAAQQNNVAATNTAATDSNTVNNNAATTAANTAINADSTALADAEFVHQSGNKLYIGRSEAAPEVGDMRITFKYVLPGQSSLIAKVQGDTFVKFTAKNGKSMSMIRTGSHSMDEMFQVEKDNNSMLVWVLRLIGVFLCISGFKMIFGILYMLFKVLPFLADIVEMGVGLVAGVLGIAWSLIIIAIAWLFYRPIIGILFLAAVGGLITWAVMRGKKKKQEAAAAAK
ncbi:MAG: hypothetical protein HUK08_06865 [Bacteroidaceae bacterium]|nr:hypothetical protein [Bacteroidaceae bacterium]